MSSYVVRYKGVGEGDWRCMVVRGAKSSPEAVGAVLRAESHWNDSTEIRVEPTTDEALFGAQIINLEETPKK